MQNLLQEAEVSGSDPLLALLAWRKTPSEGHDRQFSCAAAHGPWAGGTRLYCQSLRNFSNQQLLKILVKSYKTKKILQKEYYDRSTK